MSLTAFSFSRIEGYETCPKKFHAISVAKTCSDPPNEHTTYGTDLHLAFANYFKKGKPLPLHLRMHTPMLAKIKTAPGEFIVEQQIAIDSAYKQTGWFDKDAYCRVISDLTIMHKTHAVMFDWKTGKMKDDFTQLRLAAAVMFLIAEELETISMHFVWTKTKKITSDKMTRDEMPQFWADFQPRMERYQTAFDTTTFEARSGFHCRYCPLTTCPFNEKK